MVGFHSTRLSAGALCAVALAAAVVLPQLGAGQEDGLDVGDDAEFGFFHHDVDETTVAVGGRFVCALEAGDEEVGGIPSCWGRNKHNNCNPPKVRALTAVARRAGCVAHRGPCPCRR